MFLLFRDYFKLSKRFLHLYSLMKTVETARKLQRFKCLISGTDKRFAQ